jgi:hypothetical protein
LTFGTTKKGMSLLATNILQRKAPKVLSLQAFQGVADRNYRRVLLMFDKGDGGVKGAGGVKELLGEGGRSEREGCKNGSYKFLLQ